MIKNKQPGYIECPFCSGVVKPQKGMIKCPECAAVFYLDDSLKGIFVKRSDMRLPIDGTICVQCGLVQNAGNRICKHCSAVLCRTVH
jgi:hypothetical protein